MEQTDKKEGARSFLDKVKENTEDELQILGTFVRLGVVVWSCLLYTSPSPRDAHESRMPSSA